MASKKISTTTKVVILIVVIFILMGFMILSFDNGKKPSEEFEKVGYFINEKSSIKIYSYYTKVNNFDKIKAHAQSLPWKKGGVTHVYYFNDRENTPNVTHLGVKLKPRFRKNCIAYYYKLTNGKGNFTKYPFKTD
ncbi:MAG TPA: hypothetical protein VKP78_02490 [bacterium]|nr:hypothetical protein [bacterium]